MTAEEKITSREDAALAVNEWQRKGERWVFTNGCFDILHSGHARFLEDARHQGDRLLVALNSDSSVQRLKGEGRPLIPENERAYLLASLASVDLVVIFEEDTPLSLIKYLRPDVLVKGGDYRIDQIVGHKEVTEYGGDVRSLAFYQGFSTTSLVKKILRQEKEKK